VSQHRLLRLTEYRSTECLPDEVAEEEGRYLWDSHRDKLTVEPPTFATANRWRLTSNGWVGYLPVSDRLGLSLQPKVPLANVFRMLEYAYRQEFEIPGDLFDADTVEDLFERLAMVLARRVLDRARQGLYRTYVGEEDDLPYLRGSLDVDRHLRRPWTVRLPCRFEEHTADVEENQILAWTLHRIARSGLCSDRTLPTISGAYRTVQAVADLRPFDAAACVGRLYHRLNQDYEPLHALCRFFLENTGPTHQTGTHSSIPFLIDMAALFERFVAAWLDEHLPAGLELEKQEHVRLSPDGELEFVIDLVLYRREPRVAVAVLDTKYKIPDKPSTSDIAQVVAYAEAKGCGRASLIYPAPLPISHSARVGGIEVLPLIFDVREDLERGGQALLATLARWRDSPEGA
jgi:5-methylcytosine-specific restriction enzyme subunit McrC